MPEPLPQQQTMEEVDALILSSIRRYEDILTLFIAINSEVGDNNPATLHAGGMDILQLQEQAALADHTLITMMQEMNPIFLDHPLLSKRQDIMHQILTQNRSLLSATNNIKSLLAHEIREIQGGRAALNGYQRQINPSQNGGILNDSQ